MLFFFLFSFKKIALKIDKHGMWSYYFIVVQQTPWIWFFFNSIQNFHVHEPSNLVENVQHLHITTEKNLTSSHCLKLKSLGYSVLKYIVLMFCWRRIETSAAFAF